MKPNLLRYVLIACASLGVANLTSAQNADKAVDQAIKQAEEAAKKMNLQMPDIQKMMADDEKEEAQEKAKAKAKMEAALAAPGPAAFPDWTPKVPQFTPAGAAAKKMVEDKAQIIQTGTSPLTPAELGDAWDATKLDNTISRGRTNSNINDTKTVTLHLATQDNPPHEVTLEATRAPGEKITHVTITSPLPVAKSAGDDD